MTELIRKPRAKVERRAVEAALLRLLRYPGTTSVGMVMRMVDEYAASQHTELVHRHAEKVVAEALVEAARVQDRGKKIFVCENVEDHEKFFCSQEKIFTGKKIFIEVPAQRNSDRTQAAGDLGTNLGTNYQTKVGTNRTRTVDVSTVPPVRDTSDKDSLATFATDTRDTATAATDKGGLATMERDKDSLATAAPDTGDSSGAMVRTRVADSDMSSVRAPVDPPNVDMATHENGKSEPGESLPVLGVDAAEKACSRCGRVLALSCYTANRSRADGRASACRDCESERKTGRTAEWRLRGPETGL